MLRPVASTRNSASVLVVLLHVLFVAALLRAVITDKPKTRDSETTLVLLPLLQQAQKAAPSKAHGGSAPGAVSAPLPSFVTPDSPSSQALSIGQALFGCRPENLREMTAEQQAKCLTLARGRYLAMKDGLPLYVKPPGPEWEGLRNSDLRARERNTSDPCQAAKATGTECIHEVIFGKGLW
ncbi:MAG: hypothetical protein P4L57_13675 [Rhizomicrobium sp.]|nr:hypothetical protein [Rhizomicrobium sp.]